MFEDSKLPAMRVSWRSCCCRRCYHHHHQGLEMPGVKLHTFYYLPCSPQWGGHGGSSLVVAAVVCISPRQCRYGSWPRTYPQHAGVNCTKGGEELFPLLEEHSIQSTTHLLIMGGILSQSLSFLRCWITFAVVFLTACGLLCKLWKVRRCRIQGWTNSVLLSCPLLYTLQSFIFIIFVGLFSILPHPPCG